MKFFSPFFGYLLFLKSIKLNNLKKIIFFSESRNYRNYLQNLIKALDEQPEISIIYITSDSNDSEQISKNIKPIYIGSGFFRILLFYFIKCEMVIMTLTDLGNHEIKRSKFCKNYVYLFHSLVSTHKCYTHEAFKNYDIILSNGEYQKKELEHSEKIFNFKKKKIYNTGYLYLEELYKNKNKDLDKDKILFAPSWNNASQNLFDDYAEKIIDKLIEKKYKTILRTHPETAKRSNKNLNKIAKKYSSDNNFELSLDLRNLVSLNETSVLITDNGGIALEYMIVQRKPVLYIDYSEKIHNKFFNKFVLETFEDKIKKEIGTIISVKELDQIDFYLKEAKKNFHKNSYKIDKLSHEFGLIMKNQTQNKKDIIFKLLENN